MAGAALSFTCEVKKRLEKLKDVLRLSHGPGLVLKRNAIRKGRTV